MGMRPAGDDCLRRVKHRLIARIGTVALPTDQLQRLGLAKAERRVDLVDAHREIDVAAQRPRGLVADEAAVAADRALAPHDDHAARVGEILLDRIAPLVAATKVGVPPYGKAVSRERVNQWPNARSIFRFVGNEHVAHERGPPRRTDGRDEQ